MSGVGPNTLLQINYTERGFQKSRDCQNHMLRFEFNSPDGYSLGMIGWFRGDDSRYGDFQSD